MPQANAVDVSDTDDPSDVPRLTNYSRSDEAEKDILELRGMRGAQLVDAFRQGNEGASGYRQTEALIAFARRAVATRDQRAISGLFDLLVARCQVYFRKAMRGVRNPEERMAIQEVLLEDVIQGITRGRPQDEFLQARFWRWLKLRMFRRIAETKRQREKSQLLDDQKFEEDDDGPSLAEEIASNELSAEEVLLLREGLAVLPEELRELYILRHLERWKIGDDRKPSTDSDEPTLAEHFRISARAITKRLAKAEKLLASYRKDPA